MKTLLIVESPAKCKTIEKLLGGNYIVLSSFGHIRNLDKKNLGIDIENDFRPIYKLISDRSKQIKAIQEIIKKVDKVLLASDEDREGEAIAWHCAIVFKLDINIKNRICFHEITKTALENAVANPRIIDMAMVYSQQARRILDRLVGFKLSPLLWKYIAPKLSAGRVQSSALKIIIDKDIEVKDFTENIFFKTKGLFEKNINSTLNINFLKKSEIHTFLEHCKKATFSIKDIQKKEVNKTPPPPYITSTIQQDLGNRFGIGSKKIMSILQKLYENGLITYHRTDSTYISDIFKEEIKNYILNNFDKKYLHSRNFKSKIKCAQEAHECIRPTNILTIYLNEPFDEIEKKIYEIIWKRTIATQMSASISNITSIYISISNRLEFFISNLEILIFDGYKKIYTDFLLPDENDENNINTISDDSILNKININDTLKYINIKCEEKYKNPPPRYTESTFIKKMEKVGIGRPSTYSNIIETLLERKYVEKNDIKGKKTEIDIFILEKNEIKNIKENIIIGSEKKKIIPTDLGFATNKFLSDNFTNIINSEFTSSLEEKLDEIVNNNLKWNLVVQSFYNTFIPNVEKLNNKENISKNYSEKKRLLGKIDDNNVYAFIGKFGSVFQLGDDNEATFLKMNQDLKVDEATLEDFINTKKYPIKIGLYKDKEIFLKKGPYGFYLFYDSNNFKIINQDLAENINIDQAIEYINSSTDLSKKIIDKKYLIKNGPYGYYILFNKKFYNIPKEYDIENLDKEQCEIIIKIPKKKFNKK
jgi:DNA topoisomerase-1